MAETKRKQAEFYTLTPVYPPESGEFMIANASGGHCGRMTTGMGGSNNQICVPCAEVVMTKRAVGAIKWD